MWLPLHSQVLQATKRRKASWKPARQLVVLHVPESGWEGRGGERKGRGRGEGEEEGARVRAAGGGGKRGDELGRKRGNVGIKEEKNLRLLY